MPEGKKKFIMDAVRVVEGRIAALKEEYERRITDSNFGLSATALDRAAILEAEHCARLIRRLADAPYRGDPYQVARDRWEGNA